MKQEPKTIVDIKNHVEVKMTVTVNGEARDFHVDLPLPRDGITRVYLDTINNDFVRLFQKNGVIKL